MVEEIDSFIESRVESEESLTLFDAFCGTGAVSDRLKINSILSLTITLNGRLFIQQAGCMPRLVILNGLGLTPLRS